LFQNPVIVPAFLDRLLHHSVVINTRGNSYRLRDKIGKASAEKDQYEKNGGSVLNDR
jgi:hypothetical protein